MQMKRYGLCKECGAPLPLHVKPPSPDDPPMQAHTLTRFPYAHEMPEGSDPLGLSEGGSLLGDYGGALPGLILFPIREDSAINGGCNRCSSREGVIYEVPFGDGRLSFRVCASCAKSLQRSLATELLRLKWNNPCTMTPGCVMGLLHDGPCCSNVQTCKHPEHGH
jgi:hypothetical protein